MKKVYSVTSALQKNLVFQEFNKKVGKYNEATENKHQIIKDNKKSMGN